MLNKRKRLYSKNDINWRTCATKNIIIIIISLLYTCNSTAEERPSLIFSRFLDQDSLGSTWVKFINLWIHLVCNLPLLFFLSKGVHSVTRLVHLLSWVLVICPAHFHFNCFNCFSWFSLFFYLFWCTNNFLFKRSLCCFSLMVCFLVKFQVSAPKLISGRIHWL